MTDAPPKNGLCDLTTPLSGVFVTHGLELYTTNLPTKFEVSISSSYEDIKGDTKCGKWGGLGQLGVTHDHWK